jgi:hypothetical protein
MTLAPPTLVLALLHYSDKKGVSVFTVAVTRSKEATACLYFDVITSTIVSSVCVLTRGITIQAVPTIHSVIPAMCLCYLFSQTAFLVLRIAVPCR